MWINQLTYSVIREHKLKWKYHCIADILFGLFILNYQQIYLFGQIQTSQTGGQLYNDTSPYGECSLVWYLVWNSKELSR